MDLKVTTLDGKDAGSVTIEVSPGMDARHPEMRLNAGDGRKVKQPDITYEVKRAKTEFGYTPQLTSDEVFDRYAAARTAALKA